MKPPRDVVASHEQKIQNACVAWGIELILKLHEKIGLNEYPLQEGGPDPVGYGFGLKEQAILKGYGIDSRDEYLDFPDFEALAESEARSGNPLIFSIPDHIIIRGQDVNIVLHTWLATWKSNSLQYLSRAAGYPHVTDQLPLAAIFAAFRAQLSPHYKIHCLLHKKSA